VLPTVGPQVAIVVWLGVALSQERGVETLQWATTVVVLEKDMVVLVGTVTVTSMKVDPQELHSWVLWEYLMLLDIVGFVVDVGEPHMHMVVRARLHLTVKDVVDKVEQVEVVLSKSAICNSVCCRFGCPYYSFRPRKGSFFMFLYK
jgi:hypothetical protein